MKRLQFLKRGSELKVALSEKNRVKEVKLDKR